MLTRNDNQNSFRTLGCSRSFRSKGPTQWPTELLTVAHCVHSSPSPAPPWHRHCAPSTPRFRDQDRIRREDGGWNVVFKTRHSTDCSSQTSRPQNGWPEQRFGWLRSVSDSCSSWLSAATFRSKPIRSLVTSLTEVLLGLCHARRGLAGEWLSGHRRQTAQNSFPHRLRRRS